MPVCGKARPCVLLQPKHTRACRWASFLAIFSACQDSAWAVTCWVLFSPYYMDVCQPLVLVEARGTCTTSRGKGVGTRWAGMLSHSCLGCKCCSEQAPEHCYGGLSYKSLYLALVPAICLIRCKPGKCSIWRSSSYPVSDSVMLYVFLAWPSREQLRAWQVARQC